MTPAKVEENTGKSSKNVPIPVITTSAERKNISARGPLYLIMRIKTTYIYLISFVKSKWRFILLRGK